MVKGPLPVPEVSEAGLMTNDGKKFTDENRQNNASQ